MNDNAKLYSKFLEQTLLAFVSATGRPPRPAEMPQIRTIATKLAMTKPEVRIVSVTLINGVMSADFEAVDETSLSA